MVFIYLGASLTQDLLKEVPSIKLLDLIKYTNSEGEKATFQLITEIQTHCEDIGIQLDIDGPTIEGLHKEYRNPVEFCRNILSNWMDRDKDEEVTWEKLLKVLDELKLGRIAKKLKIALKSRILKN